MRKKIAIITGASGGIGKEFTKLMMAEEIDEIWAIARNQQKLNALQLEFGERIVPIQKDLTMTSQLYEIGEILKKANPIVAYLINNAGVARMGSNQDFSVDEIDNTVNLNCKAPVVLCSLCIPYMEKDSRILNISSASSFQPTPYLNLYASTKAFERSYSRALNIETKPMGITVTAVCPSWVDTQLLPKEINGKKVKYHGLLTATEVAVKALKDAKKGKDMSICSLYVKCQHINVKLMPQKLTMKLWTNMLKKYL